MSDMEETMRDLSKTALRVKAERDEAVRLLHECLLYSALGQNGVFKTKVREFLERLGVIANYADTMIKRDQLARHEGRPDHDMGPDGCHLKEGS